MRGRLMLVAVLAFFGACSTEPGRKIQDFFSPSKGQAALGAGLRQYEEGDYADATKNLAAALEQGLNEGEQVDARKHLAFIYCAARRIAPCREEFRKALAIDPRLELSPAEAGHPTWGPVFRALKSGR